MKPESFTIFFSEILPVNKSDMKLNDPFYMRDTHHILECIMVLLVWVFFLSFKQRKDLAFAKKGK